MPDAALVAHPAQCLAQVGQQPLSPVTGYPTEPVEIQPRFSGPPEQHPPGARALLFLDHHRRVDQSTDRVHQSQHHPLAPPRNRAHTPSVPICPEEAIPDNCSSTLSCALRPAPSIQRCTVLAPREHRSPCGASGANGCHNRQRSCRPICERTHFCLRSPLYR